MSSAPRLTLEEWRAKRALRREKQRALNVSRAASMHAARLAWENELKCRVRGEAAAGNSGIHVGCSGWFYWHWRGRFYPSEMATAEWFEHYAVHFKTVELNAPFYAWPTVGTVETWKRQAGRRKF